MTLLTQLRPPSHIEKTPLKFCTSALDLRFLKPNSGDRQLNEVLRFYGADFGSKASMFPNSQRTAKPVAALPCSSPTTSPSDCSFKPCEVALPSAGRRTSTVTSVPSGGGMGLRTNSPAVLTSRLNPP